MSIAVNSRSQSNCLRLDFDLLLCNDLWTYFNEYGKIIFLL
jgi:hypothetical protein